MEVLFGAAEGHGVAQRAARGDIVNDLFFRHAEKVFIEKLEVFLFREGDIHEILDGADFLHLDAITFEHALVETRILLQILQCLVQFSLLEGFNFLRRGEFYVVLVDFHYLVFLLEGFAY